MKNKYYFSDFTLENYRRILESAKKEYDFISYKEYKRKGKHILLRHDIDYSMCGALELAKIEKELGIRATYFLFPNSDGYNVFETVTAKMVREIINMGHDIGVHLDYSFYRKILGETGNAERVVEKEIEILEEIFKCKITAVSFHQPEYMGVLNLNQETFAGVVNVYSEYINQHYRYCSDSNGYWRFERLEDLFNREEYMQMQILLHPVWWVKEEKSPAERIWHYYLQEAEKKYKFYCENLRDGKRLNIGEELV